MPNSRASMNRTSHQLGGETDRQTRREHATPLRARRDPQARRASRRAPRECRTRGSDRRRFAPARREARPRPGGSPAPRRPRSAAQPGNRRRTASETRGRAARRRRSAASDRSPRHRRRISDATGDSAPSRPTSTEAQPDWKGLSERLEEHLRRDGRDPPLSACRGRRRRPCGRGLRETP